MKSAALWLAIAGIACTRSAPVWTSVDTGEALEVVGAEQNVSMAIVRLRASDTFRFAAGSCQEVLVFVERGRVRTDMHWFEAGQGVRFSAPAVIQAMSEDGARLFAVTVTHGIEDPLTPSWDAAPDAPSCSPVPAGVVPSDPADTGPFVHANGNLTVRIYLDGRGMTGAASSLGTLSGTPTFRVPEHVHKTSDEVLWFRDGSGTMTLGDTKVSIEPGAFVFVPRGTPHSFQPDGSRHVEAYQAYTPSGPEQRFRVTAKARRAPGR
ncbi:MAG: cupin domain-containing protein [Myxococcota bacterium]